MNKSRLILVAALLLVLGGGVWGILQLGSPASEKAGQVWSTEEVSSTLEGASGGSELRSSAEVVALPSAPDLEGVASDWSERYPNGRVAEVRLLRGAEGILRRQHLIATGGKRIPWVVWEDKIEGSAASGFVVLGSAAYMGNVFLIEARPEVVSEEELAQFASEQGLFVERRSALSDYVCLGFEDPALGKLEARVAAFKARFPEALAEFDTLNFSSAIPSDWDGSRMWGLDKVNARDAWQFEQGDAANQVVVAIIDTGTQRLHPDLVGNLFANPGDSSANHQDDDGNGLVDDTSGWDFVDNDSDPQDDEGHGTHVSGIVGAVGNNGIGAVGVNWGVRILPLRVGDAEGLRTSAINDALLYVSSLKRAGVNIVATNNSYGSGGFSQSTRNEITVHEQLGILFVAAAGNDGKNMDASSAALEYPAGYTLDNIISVGSSNQEDTLNYTSNYGRVSVDISAPGSDIYSTYPTNSYEFLSGTSMASPMVAGAVALLAQAEPDLSASECKTRLLETGDLVSSQSGQTVSGRRLNLLAALRPALKGHFLEVTNIKDAMVLLDSTDSEVVFETATHAGANVTAAVFYGNEVGDIEPSGEGVFTFVPKATGQAKIRFSANLGGIERSVEKTVVVGNAASVDDGLLHHFGFDGTGNIETDLAGNSNGTVSGATRRSSEYGSSLGFDAATENMAFDGQFSDLVTIAALVKSDDMSASAHPRILNMPYYYLYFSSGDGLEYPDGNRQTLKFFSNYSNFGVWNSPPHSVEDGQWYYIVGSYDSTNLLNTPSLYLNGEQQTVRLQQEPTGSMLKTGGLSFVGNSENGDRAFDGVIADIRIYDRTLSPVEVSQLGASLVQDRWDSVEIAVRDKVVRSEETLFEIEDPNATSGKLDVSWRVPSDAGVAVSSSNGRELVLNFATSGTYKLAAYVSDGVATRVIQKEIVVWDGRVTEGHYLGRSTGDGIAWLEVGQSLTDGYVSVFDPETGFYRIREPVTISEDGSLSSGDASKGRIHGIALHDFEIDVEGYDLRFEGELQSAPSSQSVFAGEYLGGGVGQPGDSVRLEVEDDGRVFLWREGPFADIALGTHGLDGRVMVEAASGAAVDLLIDPASDSVVGSWGGQRVFLSKEGVMSDSRFLAGIVGGYPGGSGPHGLYSEFLKQGETTRDSLRAGGFSSVAAESLASGPLVVLSANGASVKIDEAEGGGIAGWVARAIDSGKLEFGTNEARGIRLQTPLSDAGSGLVGFSIVGNEPLEVLVRGLGPSFAAAGAEDPAVSIYRLLDGEAVPLAPNDDWRDGALFTGEGESAQGAFRGLVSGFEALDLSQIPDAAKDAAQRVWLEPGDYLVLVQLVEGEAGSALVEVFAL